MIDGTLRGRNELVAEFIENETGVERGRKQVSSHIQVLIPKVAEYPLR
jgi:transcriptional enhancer factor